MGSSSSCSKVSPDSISSPYKYISDLEDSYYNSKAIKMKPIIFSQQQRKKVIVPKCVWFKRFEIKYAFPIIPICCDGENVDFNVGCDYYFINNNNEIGYLKLTYEENDSITPRVEHEIVREVNVTNIVEKRMLKIANLLLNPISKTLSSQIQDLNCDLP